MYISLPFKLIYNATKETGSKLSKESLKLRLWTILIRNKNVHENHENIWNQPRKRSMIKFPSDIFQRMIIKTFLIRNTWVWNINATCDLQMFQCKRKNNWKHNKVRDRIQKCITMIHQCREWEPMNPLSKSGIGVSLETLFPESGSQRVCHSSHISEVLPYEVPR